MVAQVGIQSRKKPRRLLRSSTGDNRDSPPLRGGTRDLEVRARAQGRGTAARQQRHRGGNGYRRKCDLLLNAHPPRCRGRMNLEKKPNQALQATAVKRLGWHVGCQWSAVPELIR